MGSPTARLRLFEVTSKRATSVSSLRRHPPEVDPGTRSGFGFWYGLERMECVCYQTYERRYVANGMKPTKQGSMLAQCAICRLRDLTYQVAQDADTEPIISVPDTRRPRGRGVQLIDALLPQPYANVTSWPGRCSEKCAPHPAWCWMTRSSTSGRFLSRHTRAPATGCQVLPAGD